MVFPTAAHINVESTGAGGDGVTLGIGSPSAHNLQRFQAKHLCGGGRVQFPLEAWESVECTFTLKRGGRAQLHPEAWG